jgi:beta-xylosidase
VTAWLPPLPGQPPRQLGPWDPDIFHDPDTGRWFMYWGSPDTYPIWGIELDFARRLTWMGEPKELTRLDPGKHGWERFGRDHREARRPFVEGAHMTKHGGLYYLQYAAPGIEYNVYANGVYVGRDPLGPFTSAPYNPVSYRKPARASSALPAHPPAGVTDEDPRTFWVAASAGTDQWVIVDLPREVEVRALTVGQEYAFAVEAFDENGVSPLSAPMRCP